MTRFFRPAEWRGHAAGHAPRLRLATLLLSVLLLSTTAYQGLDQLQLQPGRQDLRFVAGFHEPETLPESGEPMRWSSGRSSLLLPPPAELTPLRLALRLGHAYPPGYPDPQLELALTPETTLSFPVARTARRYQLLVPAQLHTGWGVPIALRSSTIELAQDPRPLGLIVSEVRLSAASRGLVLPPLWQLIAFAGMALGAYGLLRGLGVGVRLAWGAAALLCALLASALVWRPLEVAPFTMRVAGLLGLGALYGGTVRLLLERREGQRWIPATRLPLVLGLAYWLMPTYQFLMTIDGVQNVDPAPATQAIMGATVLASLLGLALLATLGRLERWQALLTGILAIAAVAHLISLIVFALGRSAPDFWVHFRASREWFRNGTLYDLNAIQENHFGHVFKLPPFYAMLYLPFVQQDGLLVLRWFRILNVALLAATLILLFRHTRIRLFSAAGAALLLLFNLRPATDAIAFGQPDILFLLLLVLALIASQRGSDTLAGAAVAVATLCKLYPALMLIFFIAKRQWHALAGFVVTVAVLSGLSIAVMGASVHSLFLRAVLPGIGGGTAWVENQTLGGFLSRLVAPEISANRFDHPAVTLLTRLSLIFLMGLAALLARQPAERRSTTYMLQFVQFPVLMVLALPSAWIHYQAITLLAFTAVLLVGREHGLSHWRAALLGLAYGLVAYGNQWSFYTGPVMGLLTVIGISYKFYGLLLLHVVLVSCLPYGRLLPLRVGRIWRRSASAAATR